MALNAGVLKANLKLDKSQYSAGLQKAGTEARGFSKKGGVAFSQFARVAKIALVAVSAAVLKTVVDATKFQKQLANVSTMVTKNLRPTMDRFRKDLLRLSKQYGQTTKALSDGLYDILSASIPAADAMNVLEIATVAATAGMTDTGVAADALTTMINAYELSAYDAADVSDLLFAVVMRGKTTFAELAPTVGTVATLASEAGVSMKELGSMIAILTRRGLSTELAMTAMRGAITGLLKPSDEAMDTAESLGIAFGGQAVAADGLLGVMESIKDLPPDVLTKLFPNVRGLQAVISGAGELNDEMIVFDGILGGASTTVTAANKVMDTFAFTFGQFRKIVSAGSIEIGENFIPGLTLLFRHINNWLTTSEGFKQFWVDLGQAFTDAVTWIIAFAQNSGPIFQWLGQVFGPLYRTIKSFFTMFWETFTEITNILFGSAEDTETAFNIITTVLKAGAFALNAFFQVGKFVFSLYLTWIKAFVGAMRSLGDVIGLVFQGKMKEAGEAAKDAWENIKLIPQEIGDNFKAMTGGIKDSIEDIFGEESQLTIDDFKKAVGGTMKEVGGLTEETTKLFEAEKERAALNRSMAEIFAEDRDLRQERIEQGEEEEEQQQRRIAATEEEILLMQRRQVEDAGINDLAQVRFQLMKREEKQAKDLAKEEFNLRNSFDKLTMSGRKWSDMMATEFVNAWVAAWDVTEGLGKAMKEAIKDLFASLLTALSKQLIVAAWGYALALQFGKAAAATGASIGAAIAASLIRGLVGGGMVGKDGRPIKLQGGGGLFQGRPGIDTNIVALTSGEFVVPPTQTAQNLEELEAIRAGESAGRELTINPMPLNIQIDGEQIVSLTVEFLQEESERGNIILNPRAIQEG